MQKYLLKIIASITVGYLSLIVSPTGFSFQCGADLRDAPALCEILKKLTGPIQSSLNSTTDSLGKIQGNTDQLQKNSDWGITSVWTPFISKFLGDYYNWAKDTYNAAFSSPAKQDELNERTRYQILGQMNLQEPQQQMEDSLNNLFQFGSENGKAINPSVWDNQGKAISLQSTYGDYSALSASTLLQPDMYKTQAGPQGKISVNSDEQNALKAFLINASGVAFAPPNIDFLIQRSSGKTLSDDAKKYLAYQRSLAALQSIAIYNLTSAYAERYPFAVDASPDGSPVSYKSLLANVNTGDPSSSNYWGQNGSGGQNLIVRMRAAMTSFFAINYTLQQVVTQLAAIRVELATLITQNNINLQNTIGNTMYTSATKSAESGYHPEQ